MPGITNSTNVTMDRLMDIANISTMPEFAVNVNHDIYNGYLYFTLLFVLGIILYFTAQKLKDQPLNNIMYSSAVLSVISFIMRLVAISKNGIIRGLLTDKQMWLFPLITIILAALIWGTRD